MVNYSISFFLGSIIDLFIRSIKIPFGLIREFLRNITNYLEAMKTFKFQIKESRDEAVLIHRCLDNNSFKKNLEQSLAGVNILQNSWIFHPGSVKQF